MEFSVGGRCIHTTATEVPGQREPVFLPVRLTLYPIGWFLLSIGPANIAKGRLAPYNQVADLERADRLTVANTSDNSYLSLQPWGLAMPDSAAHAQTCAPSFHISCTCRGGDVPFRNLEPLSPLQTQLSRFRVNDGRRALFSRASEEHRRRNVRTVPMG